MFTMTHFHFLIQLNGVEIKKKSKKTALFGLFPATHLILFMENCEFSQKLAFFSSKRRKGLTVISPLLIKTRVITLRVYAEGFSFKIKLTTFNKIKTLIPNMAR